MDELEKEYSDPITHFKEVARKMTEKKAAGKNNNGYVFSFSIRGGTDDFKSYVLDNNGYVDENGEDADKDATYKIKTRVTAREPIKGCGFQI